MKILKFLYSFFGIGSIQLFSYVPTPDDLLTFTKVFCQIAIAAVTIYVLLRKKKK
jgi:hypothetical protein